MADAAAVPGPLPGSRRLYSAAEVGAGWDRVATALQPRVATGETVLLGVLMGALPTLVALAQRLRGDLRLDTCRLARYRGSTRAGELQWLCAPAEPLAGRRVVVVDDIHDDGVTLAAVVDACRAAGATEVLTAVLLTRAGSGGRGADFSAFSVGPGYVFGCGMDVDGRYRELPDLYVLPAQ